MAAKHESTYVFNTTIPKIRAVILNPEFSSFLNIGLKSENPTDTGVWYRFHHGMTFTSYGEKITITLTVINETSTQVHILSECGLPTQIVDWGKNKQNVTNIYKHLHKLTFNAPPTAQVQTPPPATAQSASQPRAKFCSNCGAPTQPGANF